MSDGVIAVRNRSGMLPGLVHPWFCRVMYLVLAGFDGGPRKRF